MDPAMSEEIGALRDLVNRFMQAEVVPVMDGHEKRGEFPREQIFGGYGLASEYRVSWLKSYADLFFTGEGSANVQKILIAEDALGYKLADRHHGKTGRRAIRA